MRYPRLLSVTALVSFGLVWLWVATMPMAFMESEYAAFQAKRVLLDRCDLGSVLVLGDSRAAADIIPARLPVPTTNLALGGGESIEAYVALTKALRCPIPPRLVIISLDPGHFARADLFWERSVRYGWLTGADIAGLRDDSERIGDMSVYAGHRRGRLPLWLRDALEQVRFPRLYFASLVHGGGFLRWWHNRHMFQATLADRGHYHFGTAEGSDAVALDGHLPAFRPLPILDRYFDKILALLASRGIEARFIAMPINQATWRTVRPGVRDGFAAYLDAYSRRYPLLHVDADLMPHLPNGDFGDEYCHLNPAGAERFSAALAQRLQDAPPSTQNDAQNGWLSETARDAARNVAPISKRGS